MVSSMFMRAIVQFLSLQLLFIRYTLSVRPIEVKGSEFINSASKDRFHIVGVAYQPGGSSGYDGKSGNDPLSDSSVCLRDAALMQRLGINAIRVYNVNPSANHDMCASIFNAVGIYMIVDVNSPLDGESLSRVDPNSTYTADYLNRIFGVVEAFKGYPNTLGFFGGNEVINDMSNIKIIPPYIRAVTRDLKQYIAKHSTRPIPVGYSAADVRPILFSTWEYFQCAIDGDANDPTRSDFFGLNSYSWCGSDATFQSSTYADLVQRFSNTSNPVFFSEYGCNKQSPRPFNEVQALYGPDMTGVFSGGLVYEYSEEPSNYGLVNINSDGSVRLLQDYDNLQQQYNKLNITLLTSGDPGDAAVTPPKCDASLIDSPDFYSKFDIPDIPSGGQQLIDNGVKNPNQGKLIPVTDTKVTQKVEGSNGLVINGLAIQPLPDDQSNTPSGKNTSGEATGTSTAGNPKSTKKGAGSRDELTWIMLGTFVGSALVWGL
ncbi:hypothetical protein FGG08_004243 [Glutinoglossum americanum]|uniref:1,3-beta-glucanosyltransferase n=1 Tax=Glutinoglossum americanum TaxID=1670608 RepID=A0A9P8I5K8_9PEZI|nr:hypothetical protein FGG08_004243 [Glutinoglossum americanum]